MGLLKGAIKRASIAPNKDTAMATVQGAAQMGLMSSRGILLSVPSVPSRNSLLCKNPAISNMHHNLSKVAGCCCVRAEGRNARNLRMPQPLPAEKLHNHSQSTLRCGELISLPSYVIIDYLFI